MRTVTTTEFTRHDSRQTDSPVADSEPLHLRKQRVLKELRELGATSYGLSKSEAKYLPLLIHPGEHIKGVIYGHNTEGFVMVVATEIRMLYLDKKPLFVKTDELAYNIVSGVSYSFAGFFASVTIHTRIGDYKIGLINNRCARNFVQYIEQHCLENGAGA